MDVEVFDRPLEKQLCFEIYKASIGFGKMYARALKPYELTFPQYLVLLALWDREEVRIKELQKRLGVSIGTLNPILNLMEREGWVHKRKSPSDKRVVLVALTEKAKYQKKNITQSIVDEFKDSRVDRDNLQSLFSSLKHLNDELDDMEEKHSKAKQLT